MSMPADPTKGSDPFFDLVVVGAGINGAGIAREAALAGLDVLVLERSDVASGTTGASTRLIHGGLRYLEHGELGLVRESLREREALLEIAPHRVEPLLLYLPIYARARRPRWQIRVGLTLYDLLSLGQSLPRHRMLSREALLEHVPALAAAGLVGGAAYYDAQITFPERLVVENLLDAAAHGATIMSHTTATAIRVERGTVRGVDWVSKDGARGRAGATCVVNAAGPWLDRVAASVTGATSPATPLVGGTKGSHLVVTPFPGAPDAALYTEATRDGRPFFIVPWNGAYLIGTTDVRYAGDPADAAIDDDELDYLVAETERLFPGAGIARRVAYTQAGVRALPFAPGRKEGAITRRHRIHAHDGARGLYSIVGGKLTTYRSLAAAVRRRLQRDRVVGDSVSRRAADESRSRLPGAFDQAERAELEAELAALFGERRAVRLCRTYGRLAKRLAELARARPELTAGAANGSDLLRVELVHAIETEWADSLVDILQRRVMLGLGADFGLPAAAHAAAALVDLGVWDRARAAEELAGYRRYAAGHRAAALRDIAPRLEASSGT